MVKRPIKEQLRSKNKAATSFRTFPVNTLKIFSRFFILTKGTKAVILGMKILLENDIPMTSHMIGSDAKQIILG
jgi:hypothetical protein